MEKHNSKMINATKKKEKKFRSMEGVHMENGNVKLFLII